MQTLVIVIHLMIVLAMIGFVLLQKSEGGGLGIGSTGGFMTSRGTSNVLSRSTAILAGAFFATSLVLSILAGLNRHPASIVQPTGGTPAAPASGAPSAPPSGGQSGAGGLLDTLRQQEAPAGSQVPQSPQVPQSK
jgi:preprotein translocase subunit SecG